DITVKFVPYDFIKALGGEKLVDVQLGDQVEREVTVLFLDIRDFTSLAEQMTPEDNFKFVNAFNSRLGPLIREHRGFINQYLGDGIMAIFPDNAKDALHAAIDIQQSLLSFNEKRISYGRKPINVGIGMHTGSLIMGITGDEHRLDAATISDTVNTASRIESLTKHFGVSILLSEDSLDQIENKSEFHFRYLGKVQVKGRRKPVNIYECFNGDPEEMIDRKINLLDHFETGLKYYLQGSFNKAIESFDQALQINQHDMPAQLFRSKSNDLAVEGVSPEWSGIEMMDKK
ncbi:MAG: adenylate/guanylate cyclase, partial [Bacteroidia bacterium]|nr:adenylate/guanylate cyclase [Bacteroidia bacterium]